ncbi:Translation initiation factor 2 [hydrothermal vent metagenome]|uniref:Translation initiation factor 2 n=1 Tax=hydrothermal vent metagenome TaxID=652676 RepID=A0A1W1D2N9_9ZZZZ
MAEKVRIHEIAKELGIASKDVLEKAKSMGLEVKSAQNVVTMQQAEELAHYIMNGDATTTPKEKKPSIKKVSKKDDAPKEKKSQGNEAKETKVEEVQEKQEKTVSQEKKEQEEKDSASKEKKVETKSIKKEQPKTTLKIVQSSAPKLKKTGLKIVKKKKAKEVVQEVQKPRAVSSYGKISAEVLEEIAAKKKNKQAISVAKKQEQGEKLDIFGDNLAELSMDIDDQVTLLDLNATEEKVIPVEQQKKQPKQPKPIGRNANKKQAPRGKKVRKEKKKKYTKEKQTDVVVTEVEIPEDIRVYEFAEKINRPMAEVIKVLFEFGLMMTKNDFLGHDEIEILSEEFGIKVNIIDPKDEFTQKDEEVENDPDATERAPIITVMGHVDHGKTSLLDAIRQAKVTESEAGGITQHIGAYTVEQHGKAITFIDTPGHAAFSQMRQRGTDVTDIIIIVVAADDGVKPQTEEVVKLAKESGVPVIVALNKMDKETAQPDVVKGQMAELGMTPVDWGGDVEFVPVSAKTGMGIDELLENILITADVLELKANKKAKAKAVVIESSLEKGRGPVATVIVQNGTLRVGDYVVCGSAYGRVRSLTDENGKRLKELLPSHTAQVAGLDSVPSSGEIMRAVANEREARELALKRREYDRHKELSLSTKSTLEDMTSMIAEGKLKTLKIVLKTDVHGTLEALQSLLNSLRNEEVKVNVISAGVGGITENDVELASASDNCIILGFNIRPTGAVKALAKQKGVEIRNYSVIYQLRDDVAGMLTGMMAPKYNEENTGQADVKDVFKTPKGMIAGCVVVDGKLIRGGLVRVIREGVVIYEGELTSLRRFKDDVEEVGNGYECGVGIKGYDDVQVGDVIETFKRVEQKVSL